MPAQEFFALKSEADGLMLSMLAVYPEGEPRALVQLAHGMTDHKERYLPLMEYLAQRGFVCIINDHRGHGASVKCPDDLGYFYKGRDTALVEDMHQISLWMKNRWPGKKLFLLGHSMGSLAARAYCQDYDSEIHGLILIGSPGKNSLTLPVLALARLLAAIRGDRFRSAKLWRMSLNLFARRFPDPDHPCAWVSLNPENVAAYESDPLCTFSFTMNGFQTLMKLMRRAYGLHGPRQNPGLPIRFYSGADDPCAPDARGFAAAMDCMRKAGYAQVSGEMLPGLRHEILNEANREELFEKIRKEMLEANL